MSTQADINLYPTQFVLSYCHLTHSDNTVHQQDCSDVCSLSYDGSGNLVVSGWLLGYAAPSNSDLLALVLATVLADNDHFYNDPILIAASQPWATTTSTLSQVRTDSSMIGMVVLDTTAQAQKMWNGSTWGIVGSNALPLSGGTMTGPINMGGNALTNVSNVVQTTPSCVSSWSSNSVGVAYTANTTRLCPITGFTTTVNPNGDFTVNTSTGQHQYTGSATRYFRVTIHYSLTSAATANTLTHAISKNGSTTISGQRNVNTFVLLGQVSVNSYSISDIIQLATNDTVQLAGQYTATATLTYQAVSYSINAI